MAQTRRDDNGDADDLRAKAEEARRELALDGARQELRARRSESE